MPSTVSFWIGAENADEREENLGKRSTTLSNFSWRRPRLNGISRQKATSTALLLMARNRWALDHGQPIEPAALSVFGGVSEGRIRNMMSGEKRIFSPWRARIPAQRSLSLA